MSPFTASRGARKPNLLRDGRPGKHSARWAVRNDVTVAIVPCAAEKRGYHYAMQAVEPRMVRVRSGDVVPTGSWLYVWIDIEDGSIAYVGATGFDPELRAHVHLTSENPQLGRVKATVSQFAERDFDILAFALPKNVQRPVAKNALLKVLASRSYIAADVTDTDELPLITTPIIDAIEDYVAGVKSRGSSR